MNSVYFCLGNTQPFDNLDFDETGKYTMDWRESAKYVINQKKFCDKELLLMKFETLTSDFDNHTDLNQIISVLNSIFDEKDMNKFLMVLVGYPILMD